MFSSAVTGNFHIDLADEIVHLFQLFQGTEQVKPRAVTELLKTERVLRLDTNHSERLSLIDPGGHRANMAHRRGVAVVVRLRSIGKADENLVFVVHVLNIPYSELEMNRI